MMRALVAAVIAAQIVAPSPAPVKPGNGVTPPRLISSKEPKYTIEAMRAGIQGAVELEVVVEPTGRVGDVRVVQGIDPGLDGEAVAAAKEWRFIPGRNAAGQAVPVLIEIVLSFRTSGASPKIELQTPLPDRLDPGFMQNARLLSAPGVTAPVPLAIAPPEYTAKATLLKIEGSVEVDFIIDEQGTVVRARLAKAFDPDYGLNDRALAAVRSWTFRPAQQGGVAVPVIASVSLFFSLKK